MSLIHLEASSPHSLCEAQREILIRQFGLDGHHKERKELDELAVLASSVFNGCTVLVLADVGADGLVVLARCRANGDEVDWDQAVKDAGTESLLRGREEYVGTTIPAPRVEGQRKSLFGSYACTPIYLPYYDPSGSPSSSFDLPSSVGSFCVLAPSSNLHFQFTPVQLRQLKSFASLTTQDLQRRYDSQQRAKEEAQAFFVGSFLDLASARDEEQKLASKPPPHLLGSKSSASNSSRSSVSVSTSPSSDDPSSLLLDDHHYLSSSPTLPKHAFPSFHHSTISPTSRTRTTD